jgi:AAA domain
LLWGRTRATPSGVAGTRAKHTRLEQLRFLDVAALRRERPPPVDWLIEGLAARGALSLLAGQPKAGKSLLALALAGGVASGGRVAGIGCRAGTALVVDAENGADEIHRRLWGLELPARAAERLHLLEARALDLRIELARLERRIAGCAPDVVVLDSFRSLWSGRERSDAEVEALLRGLRELARRRQLALVLLHHTTKGGDPYRGSNAIAAGVDLAARLTVDEDDRDAGGRVLEGFAARLGPTAGPRSLRLQGANGRIRIEAAMPSSKVAPRGLKAEIIAATTKAGDWLDQAELAHHLGRSPSEGSLRNALAALKAEGKLEDQRPGRRRQWRLTLAYARELMVEQGR